MNRGAFVISLDFELHWGGFEKWDLALYKNYFLNTRTVIPQMLELFREYEIHVTWATVGILFHRNKKELLTNIPLLEPSYINPELSAYNYLRDHPIGEDEVADPFHLAPSLIREIQSVPFQELGTHTFSHFYCNEPGQTVVQFGEDLAAAQRIANSYGLPLKSLVFPRNQFNDSYLKVCAEAGIIAVRSNPTDWFWRIDSTQNESRWKRLNRGLDAYFPVGQRTSYKLDTIPVRPGLPLCIPASRLLRPYSPRESVLNDLKIRRILGEMEAAARRQEIYHLWWHPHNFGHYPKESLAGLQRILKHYAYCRDKWQMASCSMGELATCRLS